MNSLSNKSTQQTKEQNPGETIDKKFSNKLRTFGTELDICKHETQSLANVMRACTNLARVPQTSDLNCLNIRLAHSLKEITNTPM